MKNILFTLLTVLLVLAMLAGCAPAPAPEATEPPAAEPAETEPPAAAEPKTLKVGVLAPFTGPSAGWGRSSRAPSPWPSTKSAGRSAITPSKRSGSTANPIPRRPPAPTKPPLPAIRFQVGLLNWDASEVISVMELAAKYQIPHFLAMGTSETSTSAGSPTRNTATGWARVGRLPPS